MSKVNLTPEQLEATVNSGGPLLVSASAGSGKTKVLVDRLLKRVMGGKCDVDDFLIITFTNAAASELRGRVLGAVSDLLSEDPTNRHLRRQADLCCRAHIETIHSFCTEVIRENAHMCGVSPEFRIADEAESGELKLDALNEIFDELYDSGDSDFTALADTIGAGRDDSKLVEIILDLYNKLMSHPYPAKWIEKQLDALDFENVTDAADTVWGRYLIEKSRRKAKYLQERTSNLILKASAEEDFYAAYGPSIEAMLSDIERFIESLDKGWEATRAASDIQCPKAKAKSGYENLKAERKAIKDEASKLTKVFCDSSEKLINDMKTVRPQLTALFSVLTAFGEKYADKKKKRGVIDFADQEHLALNVLIDEATGLPTETAKELSRRFEEIMVDEYQDVNAVQDMIFSAVSRNGNNIFMVGDVKQSIYRFRLADPTIFLKKYLSFKDYNEASEGEGRRIVLAKNFRSRSGVIDSVNYVFKNIMSKDFGEMDYTDKEALCAGAEYPENFTASFELDVIDMQNVDNDESSALEKTDAEAIFTARRIKEIVKTSMVADGTGGLRPAKYGDVAILMRSPKGRLLKYTEALNAEGVPVVTDSGDDYFGNIEISIAVSMLTIIDNPHQDIPLLAVLRSPLYGFTSEELAVIRADNREGDFYSALKSAAEYSEKCRSFVDELGSFRTIAPDMSVSELFSYVSDKTGLFAAVSAMHNGSRRRANLMMLFEYAKSFESTGYKGLFGFVQYLRRLMETGESIRSEVTVENEDAVRIMSIHKSKGMEFPIVFLVDTAKQINTEDSKAPLLVHPELGVGAKYVNVDRRIEYPTLARRAVQERILEESMAEELRVLYVAMTRAKERLIVTMSFANAEKELSKLADAPLPVPPQRVAEEHSVAKWLLLPALRRSECGAIRIDSESVPVDIGDEKWTVNLIDAAALEKGNEEISGSEELHSENALDTAAFEEKFSFTYPYSNIAGIPSKVTATELNGGIKEAESAEDALQSVKPYKFETEIPAFMETKRRMTAAERGTAAHTVMQYAVFENCLTPEDADKEIERLRAFGTISDEQAAAVKGKTISAFLSSDLGRRVLSADNIWRELKFSILSDSAELGYGGEEKILLQGVIDCCIEEKGELTLIDYKTDYVNNENIPSKKEYYSGQLNAYATALERILQKPVKEKILYFLSAGISVQL